MTQPPLRLAPEAARTIRREVGRAGGREVAFLAEVTDGRIVVRPRAVARGNRTAVLAVARDASAGGVMIHNHPSGDLEPSMADLDVAGRIADVGLGTAIVNNRADRIYVVVEPPATRPPEALDVDDLAELLAPDSEFSAVPGYEDRPGQRDMLRFVARCYNDGGVGLVEAGTGTGKSLAYLVPAAQWALRNRERTIVSTNTINLQEQLAAKDMGLARRVLGAEFSWAVFKGRGNFVSIRRAHLAAGSAPSLFPDERSAELAAVLKWLKTTKDGSKSDLSRTVSSEVWNEVRSDTDACLRANCPHYQECHYQRARRRAVAADVLVVNHALFFSDLSVRIATDNFEAAAVLPPYTRVVFDEAHHVVDWATERLGTRVTGAGLLRALSRLDWGGKGVLGSVDRALGQVSGSAVAEQLRARLRERTVALVGRLRETLGALLDQMGPWVEARAKGGSLRLARPDEYGRLPQGAADSEPTDNVAIGEALDATLLLIGDLSRELGSVAERLGELDDTSPEVEGHMLDVHGSKRHLDHANVALRRCLMSDHDEGQVRWLEVRTPGRGSGVTDPKPNVVFSSAPVDVGDALTENLLARNETVVLTSATLATGRDFSFVKNRLGLAHPLRPAAGASTGVLAESVVGGAVAIEEAVVASPFDHATQSCLAVPAMSAMGWSQGARVDPGAVGDVIYQLAEMAQGGVLALFTSYNALRAAEERLQRLRAERHWPLYVQGRMPRTSLLARFRDSGRGILLGTASFWEGIDVQGPALRVLVIQKLPFRVPTHPMTQARMEVAAERGDNGFLTYMVPDAAMRLRQGVGRLIRSRRDRGAVVILDDRIVTKKYGSVFLEALPPMPLIRGPWDTVRERLRSFYGEMS